MRPWHLGNTTVRSPFRLRDGLVALSTSSLQGNLRGEEQERAFRRLLGEHGIVELGDDDTYSVGRKWRSALNKLGFLYPEVPPASGIPQGEVGPIDMITPNGWRLIRADTVPAMQECFLRALAAHYIPSALERKFDFSVFSPLRHTLSIMLELERQTGESRLNFIEMAIVVQLTSGDDTLPDIVAQVLELRARRLVSSNKRKFDRQEREAAAELHKYAAGTFNDYADTNLRYLKATGLVQSKGRGLSFVPEKHVFIEKLIQDTNIPDSDRSYFITLCNGAALPTDNKDSALVVLDDLLHQLNKRGIPFNAAGKSTETPADIAIIRHQIEGILAERNEEEYAAQQVMEWEEIAAYMELIITRKGKKTLSNGEDIEVPQAEAPAYFEWVLWRAFLAINSLTNKPYEARRFKIDQDFLPVGTAPGNGPDLIFEFEDFVIVVEVTLTDNSRQEAAEGEPVRRHVADLVTYYSEQSGKPVYGLFIANRIDSNTAETFRIGVWFTKTDDKMRLDIIPVTLSQFKAFFEALFTTGRVEVGLIRELLDLCGELRPAHEAPAWKREIDATINQRIAALPL
ncbi:AlwI family type II restriction endonuclease [Undibacterium oligocarboniphilum]|uniref:AlwI family type II restriction endonuclease n=1 Tax=Undibacterium oligocarboniphilum TaxID=666702 RepID=A0A850QFU0_9BURK|nr:AlwI family type II restriction endonuclease [Undibacterium oligocarboniphilum]MBC3871144.1 AlwI family type II restriction endonuclease [Undibacterium oligocarboniphilum]NVO76233.1 AlwI family type II restriction endonuclease [Undibacterium oligocarboniphilum]